MQSSIFLNLYPSFSSSKTDLNCLNGIKSCSRRGQALCSYRYSSVPVMRTKVLKLKIGTIRTKIVAMVSDDNGRGELKEFDHDLVIIGGGVGGHGDALHVVEKGLKTAIVKGDVIGETCVNRSCVPSKALLAARGIFCSKPKLRPSLILSWFQMQSLRHLLSKKRNWFDIFVRKVLIPVTCLVLESLCYWSVY